MIASSEAIQSINEIKKILEKPSRVQIIADRKFFFPWPLIYQIDLAEKLDSEGFWGFKHMVEQIPTINKRWNYGAVIRGVNLGFNVNENIDSLFMVNCVEEQKRFFDNINSNDFTTKTRSTEAEVFEAFSEGELHETILYFYCHAKNEISSGDSYIQLTTPENQLTLARLQALALNRNFVEEPLIFMNACESAEMSPLFYDGFVPYFMAKGSRGVIGTLSSIPAIFAAKFALRFFERFLKMEKVGDIMIELRKEFLKKYNNLLGLYYISYCRFNLGLNSAITS